MRSILIGSAAAVLAISTASTPAFAQYGGSPDAQVETAAPGDEDVDPEDAYPDEDVDMSLPPENQGAFEDEGPPPEDGAYQDDADQDVDMDVDQDVDDVDQDGADPGQTWQGEDGRSYCRRSDGTTGLIVGGGAGALVGRGIDSHGRRGTGTIIGAIAGALVGTAIERSANEQRCR
jgi:hypothetical protein